MKGAVSQFVFGFVIAFSPAPFAGFGTYAYIRAQQPAPPAAAEAPIKDYRPTEYGTPQQYEHAPEGQVEYEGDTQYVLDPQSESPDESHGAPAYDARQYEIETDCARRKRLKREAEGKQRKKPEIPDL